MTATDPTIGCTYNSTKSGGLHRPFLSGSPTHPVYCTLPIVHPNCTCTVVLLSIVFFLLIFMRLMRDNMDIHTLTLNTVHL